MSPIELLYEPLWQRWALTLVHFLWQGLVVAGVLGLAMKCVLLEFPIKSTK